MNSSRPLRIAVAPAVSVLAFGVYLRTLTPTVGFVDSGELTLAAWSLGNAHPPGFPLYLMLTHLFTLLPLGSVAVRVNIASAFFAAASCGLLTLAIGELLQTPWRKRIAAAPAQKRKKGAPAPPPLAVVEETEPLPSPIVLALVSAFGGLLLTFSRTLWAYATVAEVYALNTAMLVLIFWLMLAWRRRELAGDTRAIRWLYAAAIVFGFALGVHHVTIGVTLLGIAALVFITSGPAFFRSKQLAIAAALSIAALVLVYAYLPLAASHKPFMNWGDPDNLPRIVDHITAKQYRLYIKSDAPAQTNGFFDYASRDFGPTWLPLALVLAVAGLVQLARRDRAAAAFLLLVIAADFGWTLIYPIVNDQDAYALPALVAIAIAAAVGARAAASLVRGREALIAALLLAIPAAGGATAWRYRDRSRFDVPRNYAGDALAAMKPHALLITGDWELYSPLLYFTEVEHRRPDVRAIETGMLLRSWYIDSLERRYPELMRTVRPELEAYRPWLRKWEALSAAEWDGDPTNRIEFYKRVNALLSALITRNLDTGVYATVDVALSQDEVIQPLVKQLATDYDVVPRGVVVEYLRGHALRDLHPLPPLHTAGLNDGSTAYAADDVVVTEVSPVYRGAFLMRGRYLAVGKRIDEALAAYREALALDPDSSMIQREMVAVESQAR
jgi:tetratricopeptide (TPR) repeat protein